MCFYKTLIECVIKIPTILLADNLKQLRAKSQSNAVFWSLRNRKACKVINDADFMLLIDFRKVEESATYLLNIFEWTIVNSTASLPYGETSKSFHELKKVSSNFFFKHLKTFATLQRKIFN